LSAKNNRIAGISAVALILTENAFYDEIPDVPRRRILGHLGQLRPFRTRQLAFKSIHQAIEDRRLAIVQRRVAMTFPEIRFCQDPCEQRLCMIEGAIQAGQEPQQPFRDVQIASLGGFRMS
jgi:hypothetical protein